MNRSKQAINGTAQSVDASAREAFTAVARTDGAAIEYVIAGVYGALSRTWKTPRPVLDGGAHMGFHTLRLAALPNVSTIVAVEANPKTFASFSAQIEKNDARSKIEHVHGAIQDDPSISSISFTTSTSHPGRSGLNPIMALYDKSTTYNPPEKVPAITIDGLFADRGRDCGFIKLDLEGSEFAALRGATATLGRSRPPCVFENGPDAPAHGGYDIDDFFAFLLANRMVATTVFGEPMNAGNARDFWYGWALPEESFEQMRSVLVSELLHYLTSKQNVIEQSEPRAKIGFLGKISSLFSGSAGRTN